jgi:hypothetical protein
MAHSRRRNSPDCDSYSEISTREECDEERIANMIRKIGIVAACIDLYHWRQVIDQVLRETEAERRLQIRYEPAADERTSIAA